MNWYRVIKTIRGRKYLYWQKTYRVGKNVKTLNKYIGPASGGSHGISRVQMRSIEEDQREIERITSPEYKRQQLLELHAKYSKAYFRITNMPWDEHKLAAIARLRNGIERRFLDERRLQPEVVLPMMCDFEPGKVFNERGHLSLDNKELENAFAGKRFAKDSRTYKPYVRPINKEERAELAAERREVRKARREDERVQYGSLKARKEKVKQALRAAQKRVRAAGKKRINPFIG